MGSVRIGGGHKLRKQLFIKGIKQGFLDIEEVEEAMPPGHMTAAERWLLYFSLRSADVELRDVDGRAVTPDDLVPEKARRRREGASAMRGRYDDEELFKHDDDEDVGHSLH